MTQEDRSLLLKDLCARLPYGVKILHTGWDHDRDTDFDTVETLIGIDDKFIYTIWDKTGNRNKHCLSVSNWKPYLRPMSSMTDEEDLEFIGIGSSIINYGTGGNAKHKCILSISEIDWLNAHHFDYRDLISEGLALEAPEDMYKTE